MVLASVMDVPTGDGGLGWDSWLFNHAKDHEEIRTAIQSQKSINLPLYNLQELDFTDPDAWLERHSQAHGDMNSALGTAAGDLSQLDFKDQGQVRGWIWANFKEHQAVRQTLGI